MTTSEGSGSKLARPRLYRRFFTPAERDLLEHVPQDDPVSELNLLRVLLARAAAAWRHQRHMGWGQQAAVLSALARTALQVAALERIQLTTPGMLPEDPLLDSIAAFDLEDL